MWTSVATPSPGTVEFTNGPLLYLLFGLMGLSFLGGSLYLLFRERKWPAALAVSFGTLFSVVFLAISSTEKLVISPTEIREYSGFPGAVNTKVLDLADTKRVELSQTVKRRTSGTGSRKKRKILSLAVTNKAGVTRHINMGGLWKGHVAESIVAMKKAGIEVVDQRQ